jgi:hypothetical protein
MHVAVACREETADPSIWTPAKSEENDRWVRMRKDRKFKTASYLSINRPKMT